MGSISSFIFIIFSMTKSKILKTDKAEPTPLCNINEMPVVLNALEYMAGSSRCRTEPRLLEKLTHVFL
jgi:hypothetical protein